MRDDHGGGPPVVVPLASAAASGMPGHYAGMPSRPPSVTIGGSVSSHSQEVQRTPPPGSPMDVDFEGRSPSQSPSRKTKKPVISVFDWDDTLCPSSWLYREGLLAGYGLVDSAVSLVPSPSSFGVGTSTMRVKKRKMDTDDRHALRVLEDHVLALIHTARQFGPVFIVTAAKLHWVRNCAENFLPNVLQVLTKSESVHVISAREFYLDQSSRMGPHQPQQAAEGTPLAWKTVTFEAVCAHLRVEDFVRRSRNSSSKGTTTAPAVVDFVSVGDSLCERDACRLVASKVPALLHGKTLKFLDQPTLLEVIEQVKMTKALFDQICQYTGGLDLHIARSRSSLQVVQIDSSPQHPPPPPPPLSRPVQVPRPSSLPQRRPTPIDPLPTIQQDKKPQEHNHGFVVSGPTTAL